MWNRKIRDRFSVVILTAGGNKVRGEFGDPNSYPRPRKELQNLPHRAFVTSRNSWANAGDLVSFQGVQYLLCGQHTLAEMKRFLAVEVNEFFDWTRIEEVIDPVTKMARDVDPTLLEAGLPVCFEPQRGIEEEKFTQTQTRIFTSAAVKPGDYLGDLKVIRVANVMGLTMVEAA